MRDVYVAGTGMTPFGRQPGTSVRSLAQRAVDEAISDAQVTPIEVDTVFFANAVQGFLHGQEMIRGQVALSETGMLGKPIINVENACASGSSAAHLALGAVASGEVEVALVVGAEQLSHPDKERTFAAISTAIDVGRVGRLRERLYGDADERPGHSLFMDVYADQARRYLARTDATRRDFALVTEKSRRHASLNPLAQYRDRVSADDVLASRMITDPLTLLMCSPVGDGAAALVLCSREVAERTGAPLVQVAASILVSGRIGTDTPSAEQRASTAAYAAADACPDDIDLIELHDAAAPAELVILEELGICPPGTAPRLLREGATTLGGRIPVNTSGGLVSRGHPIGATGCAQLVELTTQLRGIAGARQVDGARVGLAENAGGHLGPDPAVACVTILRRG